jgi:hypothetical protein
MVILNVKQNELVEHKNKNISPITNKKKNKNKNKKARKKNSKINITTDLHWP